MVNKHGGVKLQRPRARKAALEQLEDACYAYVPWSWHWFFSLSTTLTVVSDSRLPPVTKSGSTIKLVKIFGPNCRRSWFECTCAEAGPVLDHKLSPCAVWRARPGRCPGFNFCTEDKRDNENC